MDKRFICTLAFTAATVTNVHATQLLNSNFETGSLSGWSYVGEPTAAFAQVVDSRFGVPSLQGDYSALLVTRDSFGDCARDPWGYGCPIPIPFAPASFTSAPPNLWGGTGFAADISQQVLLRAGDVISFEFQMFTNDGGADQFFVSLWDGIHDADHTLCGVFDIFGDRTTCPFPLLSNVTVPSAPTLLHAATGTPVGFRTWSHVYSWNVTAPSDGLWTLTLGIGSYIDSRQSSGVLVDDFHVLPAAALPEPGTLALLALSVVGIVLTRRTRTGD